MAADISVAEKDPTQLTIETAMGNASNNFDSYVRDLERSAERVRAAVIASGGETGDRSVYLFAMHGILPGGKQQQAGYKADVIAFYDDIEARFGVSSLGKVVARFRTENLGSDKLQIEEVAIVEDQYEANTPYSPKSPLVYTIKGSFSPVGRVVLPVVDTHRWGYDNCLKREPNEKFVVAYEHVATHGWIASNDEVPNGVDLTVGLGNIYGKRVLGEDYYSQDNDQEFLRRINQAVEHFKADGHRPE